MAAAIPSPIAIRTPATCPHKHTAYRLPNGASVLVVEDKDCTTPAAAMTVAVGQNNDPTDFPGLAHFCEHMLFMGTAKYPSEDAYSTAVSKSGGHSNAWTDLDTTTYYFTSGAASYKEVLEMFLDFFVAPSFNASAVDRELNAVHSEDEKNHSVDFWRLDELFRGMFSPNHPRHYYGNGNLTTLKEEPEAKGLSVHDALKSFFAKYYVAPSCALVLYSAEPAETLIAAVAPALSALRAGTPAPRAFLPAGTASPLRQEAVGKWYNVVTTRKERCLRTSWVVPDGFASWKSKPAGYISHILGHEVKGSIVAILRERGWATDLSASSQRAIDDGFREVAVMVVLTPAGVANALGVVGLIFEAIEMMRRHKSVPADHYKELKQSSLTSYELSSTGRAENYASSLSTSACRHGVEHASDGPYLFLEDDCEATMRLLEHLTVEQCVVTFESGDPEAFAKDKASFGADAFVGEPVLNNVTRFHSMPYSVCDIPGAQMQQWGKEALAAATLSEGLRLPDPNPFFAEDFAVHQPPAANGEPTRLEMKYGYALVKRNEAHLMKPLMAVTVNTFFSNNSSPEAFFFRRVMINMADVAAVDTTYMAELASLNFSIANGSIGLIINASGPSATLPAFAAATLKQLLSEAFLRQTPELFATYKQKALISLKGTAEAQPCALANIEIANFYKRHPSPLWHEQIAFATSEGCTYEAYCAFVKASLEAMRCEVVVDGNLPSVEAARGIIIDAIDEALASTGARVAQNEEFVPFRDIYAPRALGGGELYLHRMKPFSATNVNAAMVCHLYVGPAAPEHWAMVQTMANLMESHFFAALRTREALGYIVQSYRAKAAEREATIVFAAQSAVAGPMYLYSRLHAFLDAFGAQFMATLQQKDVDTAIAGVIASLSAPVTSVSSDAARVFGDRLCPYGWDHREQQIAVLKKEGAVTADKLRDFYAAYVANGGAERRGFVALIDSTKLPETHSFPADCAAPIQLPVMLTAASESSSSNPAAAATTDGADVDVKLEMATFETPTFVKFTPVVDMADAHGKADLIHIPLL